MLPRHACLAFLLDSPVPPPRYYILLGDGSPHVLGIKHRYAMDFMPAMKLL